MTLRWQTNKVEDHSRLYNNNCERRFFMLRFNTRDSQKKKGVERAITFVSLLLHGNKGGLASGWANFVQGHEGIDTTRLEKGQQTQPVKTDFFSELSAWLIDLVGMRRFRLKFLCWTKWWKCLISTDMKRKEKLRKVEKDVFPIC
jgi:hypothetical protein